MGSSRFTVNEVIVPVMAGAARSCTRIVFCPVARQPLTSVKFRVRVYDELQTALAITVTFWVLSDPLISPSPEIVHR